MKRVVFWQNILSIHQSSHIRALAARAYCDVTLVAAEDISIERQQLGWKIPDFGQTRVIVKPSNDDIQQLLTTAETESIHIFSGIRAFPMVKRAFYQCTKTKARMGLLTELQDGSGLKGKARLLVGMWDANQLKSRLNFILAVGTIGVDWYKRLGYKDSQLFPYCYFTEVPEKTDSSISTYTNTVQLLFLGGSQYGKGVDLLLQALHQLNHLDWQLKVIGDGPAKVQWQQMTSSLNLETRVQFLPIQPHDVAMAAMCNSDIFILPSKAKEGWGAVINEALMRGVPVICSDRCGAADLLGASWRGEVFPSGSVKDLRNVLNRWIEAGKKTPEDTTRIRGWSECLNGNVAADYMLAVFDASIGKVSRPVPPWLG